MRSDFIAKNYDDNFKLMTFNFTKQHGHSTTKTAKDLNIHLKTLGIWITDFNKDKFAFDPDYVYSYEENRWTDLFSFYH